jgi:hypothetical protein
VPHQVSHRHPVNDPNRPFSTAAETGAMDSAGADATVVSQPDDGHERSQSLNENSELESR